MRARLTLLIIKIVRKCLLVLGKGGSFPGQIALRLDPNILQKLKYPKDIILTTGTNGKTTTNNMIYKVMQQKYHHVICNQRGDNLLEGIATLILAHTSLGLQVNSDCIVIEVDELNVPRVMERVPVSVVLVNNFFRDQLDRAGEMDRVVSRVGDALEQYHGILVLNGDDPNVVRLADVACDAQVSYFGVDENAASSKQSSEASEGKFCFRCHTPLVYEYYQYSHIGRFYCPNCDFGHHETYVQAHDVDTHSFMIDGVSFYAPQDALYAIYNCVGVIGVAKLQGIDLKVVSEVLKTFELKDGRMEHFDIGRDCLLNLVKNPTGANEVMKYIVKDEAAKDVLIVLNDNIQDGTDVSWIWDAHFDLLVSGNTKHIICSGLRAYDMALRLKYEGYKGSLEVIVEEEQALKHLQDFKDHAYVIATYTALQSMRTLLRRIEK